MINGLNFLMLVEPVLRIICYIAFIVFAFKGIEALNVYIRKNS